MVKPFEPAILLARLRAELRRIAGRRAIKRLRDKVENDSKDPRRIVTARGAGYRSERA